MTNSSYDGPSKSLLHKLEWKSIQELIADETKIMVINSLNDLGPKYMHRMFTRNEILAVATSPLRNREFDWPIRSGGQNKSLRSKIMLATCAVCGYRANKGTGIKLHLPLLGQRDPSCMCERLSIYRENTHTYQHTRMYC